MSDRNERDDLDKAEREIERLRRWKSTHAPRIEALEGLLRDAQIAAAKGAEAMASLDSERAANARLTDELEAAGREIDTARARRLELQAQIERLQASLAQAGLEQQRAVRDERERCKARAVQIVEWHRNGYNRQQIDPIVADLRNGM